MTDEEVCAAAQAVIKVQAGKLIETIDRAERGLPMIGDDIEHLASVKRILVAMEDRLGRKGCFTPRDDPSGSS